ncbi:MAG TPA: glycosyltransferase family 39 protein, partial [Gaiellaceae bacterium]|nr:glycosyltransferase family 39 protein [Gaiellaceae bacterium]
MTASRLRLAAPLAALVAVSALVRTIVAWQRATPTFVDEYTYSSLSRSLATSGHALIRGVPAHFLPLLQPLVTAPAWLAGHVETSYRIAQAIDATAMSLAAVPVYLLARRLGLGTRSALAAAALAIATPSMLFSSLLISEPVAYPLALAAIAAGVAALDRPSPRSYATFVALVALATFARIQFAILLPCFFAAFVLLAAGERRLRSLPRSQWRLFGAFVLAAAVLLAVGPARNTGYYPSFLYIHGVHPGRALAIAGANALTLVYASGFVLVPGAVLGLVLAIARPRLGAERAFAVLCVVVTGGLLA